MYLPTSFISIAFLFLALFVLTLFPHWHKEMDPEGEEVEIKAFPSRKLTHSSLTLSTFGLFFGFTATFWQQIGTSAAASMAGTLYYGQITAHFVTTAMATGCVGVGLSSLAVLGLTTMVLSLSLIKRLADEEEKEELIGRIRVVFKMQDASSSLASKVCSHSL
jgi:hypothetical protein